MTAHTPFYAIEQVTQLTEELYQACHRLIPQLTSNNPPPTRTELTMMLAEKTTFLFLARMTGAGPDKIAGIATLVLYRVPTGQRAVIEDVVVDARLRGAGIGEALTRACLSCAEQEGCPQVMLTSNPARKAANRLYQRMGFELRKTNVYRYVFVTG